MLAATLRSLRSQRVPDLEILVVDDCSSDGTAEFVQGVSDPRVRLVRNPRPMGVAGTRNRGLEAAKGTWVAFSDDDDLWSPRKLEHQLRALREEPDAGWCAVGAVTVDEQFRLRRIQNPPPDEDVARRLLRGNCIPGGGSGVMVRANLVREVGAFDEKLSLLADWDLWIRLAMRSRMARIPQPLVMTVRHDQNMSLDLSGSLDELGYMLGKYAIEQASHGTSSDSARRELLLWMAQNDARAGRRFHALRICLSLAREQRSLVPIQRAVFLALGPRALRARDEYRCRHLPQNAMRDGVALVNEVRSALASS